MLALNFFSRSFPSALIYWQLIDPPLGRGWPMSLLKPGSRKIFIVELSRGISRGRTPGSSRLYAPRENSFSILITVSASTKSMELLDRLRSIAIEGSPQQTSFAKHRGMIGQLKIPIQSSIYLHPLDPREITDVNKRKKTIRRLERVPSSPDFSPGFVIVPCFWYHFFVARVVRLSKGVSAV